MSKSLTEHQVGRRLKCPFKLGTISPAFYAPFRVTITIVGSRMEWLKRPNPVFIEAPRLGCPAPLPHLPCFPLPPDLDFS